MNTFHLHPVLLLWAALALAFPISGRGQISPLLQLTSLEVVPGQPVQFTFTDTGTGSTNYQVEFTRALESGEPVWVHLAEAVITPLAGGEYHVVLPDPESATGFFRVRGLGGTVPIVTASFNSTAFEVGEGGMISPEIHFSGPYFGTLRYTISGTADSGDYQSLSGEVTVRGTSVTIPITLEDNQIISQLRHLTLTLEAGPGLQLGSGSETIITITENDAVWEGSFMSGDTLLGFSLFIQQSNGVSMATLQGEPSGFFPTNEIPVSLILTEDVFAATAADVAMAPEATLLGLPMNLTLILDAANGVANQLVSAIQIEGSGTIHSEVPGKPHLSSTSAGTFVLFRPPAAPSTAEIELE